MPPRVEIELDVFSGRPNPSWTLDDDAAAELLARLGDAPRPPPPGHLGYRGFLVHRSDVPSTVHVHGDQALERWLLASGGAHVPSEVLAHVRERIG